MGQRYVDVGEYAHTNDMAAADARLRLELGLSLREYLLRWRVEYPRLSFEELAREFQVSLGTLYRWFERLRLATGGPVLLDLDALPSAPAAGDDDGEA